MVSLNVPVGGTWQGSGGRCSPARAKGKLAHTGRQTAVETSGGSQAEDTDDHIDFGPGRQDTRNSVGREG